jgi:hypothetical protein
MIGLYLSIVEPDLCNKDPVTVLDNINIHTGVLIRPVFWITQSKRTRRLVKTSYVCCKDVPVLN